MKRILLCLGPCLFLSCSQPPKEEHEGRTPVARAFESYLYLDELKGIVKKGAARDDSVRLTAKYINNWIRKEMVKHYARNNPNIDESEIEEKLQNYRQTLEGYYYEREIVRQRLDTVVNESEIMSYFREYKDNFRLKEDILRFNYIRVPSSAPGMDSVKIWLRSDNEFDRARLEDYCVRYAVHYNLDGEQWFHYRDVTQVVPVDIHNPAAYFNFRKFLEIRDSADVYLFAVKEYIGKGNNPPIGYVRDDIEKIILSKRKVKLINETYERMYQEGIRKKQIEVFLAG